MHPVDPGAGQIGQRREVGLAGQPPGLETAHLAGRGRCAVKTLPAHHGAHRGIVGETFGVVHVLVTSEAAEHRLPQQAGQQVVGVLASTAFRQDTAGQISEAECVIQFSVDQDAGIGGDAAAVEFQLQAAVEIDPERPIIRFTRRVFHEPAIIRNATH
jgi:hypothetical protein